MQYLAALFLQWALTENIDLRERRAEVLAGDPEAHECG